MQTGYARDAENDTHTAAVTWLDAWSDVLRLCDATGISSIEEFDDRFPLTQSLFNWSQDLEMALENAGRDNREVLDAGRTAIRLAREVGVRIGFGTDLMGALDDEQLHGLRLQAEVEGPLALLRAATSVNAELPGPTWAGSVRARSPTSSS